MTALPLLAPSGGRRLRQHSVRSSVGSPLRPQGRSFMSNIGRRLRQPSASSRLMFVDNSSWSIAPENVATFDPSEA